MNKWFVISWLGLFCFHIFSCETPTEQVENKSPKVKQLKEPKAKKQLRKSLVKPVQHKDYKPVYIWKIGVSNQQYSVYQIPTTEGFERTQLATHQKFAYWLRHLPLQPEGSKVMLHNGRKKPYQKGAYAVLDIDIGKRDLQQCADAVMRLKAEHHYSLEDYKNIHFNYTSGHTVSFDDWRKGKQPRVMGSSVRFSSPSGKTDNSYKNFKKYLNSVFSYAGTASLSKELKPVPIAEMQIGDIFIQGGFPGHAVIVVDMALNKSTGKKQFMVAQSYMPAQSIHVLNNLKNRQLTPWYPLDFKGELKTPEWQFSQEDLKRFQ